MRVETSGGETHRYGELFFNGGTVSGRRRNRHQSIIFYVRRRDHSSGNRKCYIDRSRDISELCRHRCSCSQSNAASSTHQFLRRQSVGRRSRRRHDRHAAVDGVLPREGIATDDDVHFRLWFFRGRKRVWWLWFGDGVFNRWSFGSSSHDDFRRDRFRSFDDGRQRRAVFLHPVPDAARRSLDRVSHARSDRVHMGSSRCSCGDADIGRLERDGLPRTDGG